MFSLHLPVITIALLAASAIPVLFLLTFYRRRVASVARHGRQNPHEPDDSSLPALSVVVYSSNDTDDLAAMLSGVLAQEYPAPLEIIVVNDGSCEATKDLVEHLSLTHSNLYLTFTPQQARNLSRKKLALTIGIKAARHPIVVTTNAHARISSPHWLSSLARHFASGKDIVIGYGSPATADDNSPAKRLRAFDIAADAVTYLSAAIVGKPYRGNGYNLAYRKELFFENKGFSRSLNLHYGDDDIFINEIANGANTAVELSTASQVTCHDFDPVTAHRLDKLRYGFTARFLRKGSRRLFGFSSLMVWTWTVTSVIAVTSSLPNLLPAATVLALALILWLPLMFTWRRTLLALNSRPLLLTIPWMLHIRPIYNFIFNLKGRRLKHKNFTWEH